MVLKIAATLLIGLSLCSAVPANLFATINEIGPSTNWWEVTPESESPSKYYDSILYSDIAPTLRDIQINGKRRMWVKVIGQSAGGRNLFLVTIAAPGDDGRLGHYKALRKLMIQDPEKALAVIDRFDDFKVPVFVNGSIHGDEYPGTDACLRLIELLACDDTPEVLNILDNIILLINVVQNPDGRVKGTRYNANGFDINRDMITQSQPESRATAGVIADWNPMVFLDLHGYVDPMLIEPCTPPHNPNYEYDLYLNWALELANAMSDELFAMTEETDVTIPYIDRPSGWDDWAPVYAPIYAMLHGAYGHTLETPHRDERGVDAHFATVWGALEFVAQNKKKMIRDQIEVYRRGALDLPQVLIPDGLLDETQMEQYNALTIQDFPAAYIIPENGPLQKNPLQAAAFVKFLLHNGVAVEKAIHRFMFNEVVYPQGTNVVWMDQPKRSLANTFLEDGLDVSSLEGISFYSPPASWSHPLLWGVSRIIASEAPAVATIPIKKIDLPWGAMPFMPTGKYAVVLDTIQSFQAINTCMAEGYLFYRAETSFEDAGRLFEAGTVVFSSDDYSFLSDLSRKYRMHVSGLTSLPDGLVPMTPQKILSYGDEGLSYALTEMNFHFENVSQSEMNAGFDLSGYDVVIYGNSMPVLSGNAARSISDFIVSGGDLIGMGAAGASFAVSQGFIGATWERINGNGIVNIDMLRGQALNSGFEFDEFAYVYDSVWFSEVGENVQVAGGLDADKLFVSGYWPGWQGSAAAGMPIVIYTDGSPETNTDIVLIGFNTTFRGHPKHTFKLLGNAIYNGLDSH